MKLAPGHKMLVKFIPGLRVTPHVGPAVRRRDVQQADSLQGRTVRQIQRNSVALGKKGEVQIGIFSFQKYFLSAENYLETIYWSRLE